MSNVASNSLEQTVAAMTTTPGVPAGTAALDEGSRRQAALIQVSQRVVATANLATMLQDAATLVAETLSLEFWGTAEVRGNNQLHFCLGATDGSSELSETLRSIAATRSQDSIVAFALDAGHTVVVDNLAAETRFQDALLTERGIGSALVCPIRHEGQRLGAIGLFGQSPRTFSPGDVVFAESIAQLVGVSIARLQAELRFQKQYQRQQALWNSVDALILEMSPAGEILAMGGSGERVTRFNANQVCGQTFISTFVIPEEADEAQTRFRQLNQSPHPVEFSSYLLTADGLRRFISWTMTLVEGPEEPTILASGLDITEQQSLREQLEHAQETVRKTRSELDHLKSQINLKQPDTSRTQPFGLVREKTRTERRAKPRRLYPYVQHVAPMVDGKLPSIQDFFEVRCRDIAAGGFSFLTSEEVEHQEFVAAFGAPPALTYLTAKVRHVTRVDINGQAMMIVGCSYTGRVEL